MKNLLASTIARLQLRQVGPLGASTAIAQVLAILSLPVITRYYGPAAFGTYSLIASIAGILMAFSTLRLEIVLPTLKNSSEAKSLASGLLALSLFISLIYVFLGPLMGRLLPAGDLCDFLKFQSTATAALLFSGSVLVVLRAMAVRQARFVAVARSQFTRVAGFVGTAIAIAIIAPLFLAASHDGLIMAAFIAELSCIGLLYQAIDFKGFITLHPKRLLRSWRAFSKNKSLYGTVTFSQIISAINLQMPFWSIVLLFGDAKAGLVAISLRLVLAPVAFAATSLGTVMYNRLSQQHHQGQDLRTTVYPLLAVLIATGLLGYGVLASVGPSIAAVAFGSSWSGTGSVLSLLCILGFFQYCASSFQVLPVLLQRRQFIFSWNLCRLAGLLLALAGSWWGQASLEQAVLAVVLAEAGAQAGFILYLLRTLQYRCDPETADRGSAVAKAAM